MRLFWKLLFSNSLHFLCTLETYQRVALCLYYDESLHSSCIVNFLRFTSFCMLFSCSHVWFPGSHTAKCNRGSCAFFSWRLVGMQSLCIDNWLKLDISYRSSEYPLNVQQWTCITCHDPGDRPSWNSCLHASVHWKSGSRYISIEYSKTLVWRAFPPADGVMFLCWHNTCICNLCYIDRMHGVRPSRWSQIIRRASSPTPRWPTSCSDASCWAMTTVCG